MKRYSVMIDVHVEAKDKQDAEQEVLGLLSYAFEVSNDQGIFKHYSLSESCGGETIEIEVSK